MLFPCSPREPLSLQALTPASLQGFLGRGVAPPAPWWGSPGDHGLTPLLLWSLGAGGSSPGAGQVPGTLQPALPSDTWGVLTFHGQALATCGCPPQVTCASSTTPPDRGAHCLNPPPGWRSPSCTRSQRGPASSLPGWQTTHHPLPIPATRKSCRNLPCPGGGGEGEEEG